MEVALKEDSDEDANKKLLIELEDINKELNVPTPKEFGINEKDFMNNLEIMAEQALASGSPGNNPRVPDNKEIINIYKLLWA
jgi:alcohol dehydrogenase class IV